MAHPSGIRALCSVNVPTSSGRITQVVGVADDVAFIGNPDNTVFVLPETDNFLGDTCQIACGAGYAYIVDGTANIYKFYIPSGSGAHLSTMSAGGVAPKLIDFYLDCMVLAGLHDDEQNYILSRQGTHSDFDFSLEDDQAPVEGNEVEGAAIAGPIRAIIPYRDRQLIFGLDHSLWRLSGHPRQGGTSEKVADVGVLGPKAWTFDPSGVLYFMGESGFYRMTPGGLPDDLSSSKIRRFMASIDRGATTAMCVWDTQYMGCWIFLTSGVPAAFDPTPKNTHLWWDGRTGGFWKLQFPASMDPISAVAFNGDTNDTRIVLMGARDGYIRHMNDAFLNDQGVAISSRLKFSPLTPAGAIREGKCTGLDLIFGQMPAGFDAEAVFHCDWTLAGGRDAYQAAVAPQQTRTGSIHGTAGEQRPIGLKLAAASMCLELSNSQQGRFWSIDLAIARLIAGGRQR